ncbi:MAG: hypothetical protein EP349_05340 [Alphaproteobacteria bacterium]|nr:MAG: hypothetical protein EP349_05340 [Alphaproteobacteria bacterium]
MSDNAKPSIQDTFNAISDAHSFEDLKQGLAQIDLHSGDEKKQLIDLLETAFFDKFAKGLPGREELEMMTAMAAMNGLPPEFSDTEGAQAIHGFFHLADKIVAEKGDKADPRLHELLKKAGELSDTDYNNPIAVMKLCLSVLKPEAVSALKNPFRDKRRSGPHS